MKIKTMTITPEIAADMLKKNTRNRSVNDRHVEKLASDILAGRWKMNGDTICINGSLLIDGQHRLSAIVKANTAVECIVVEGLPSDVFDTKDIGKRRTNADTLSVLGEKNCTFLAATLAVIHRYMTGRTNAKDNYSNHLIEDLLSKYPAARHSVEVCAECRRIVPGSVLAAAHFLFSQKDEDFADESVKSLISGKGLEDNDPNFILREKLISNQLSKRKLPAHHLFAMIIKAWNARRSKTTIQLLKFSEDREDFPMVR